MPCLRKTEWAPLVDNLSFASFHRSVARFEDSGKNLRIVQTFRTAISMFRAPKDRETRRRSMMVRILREITPPTCLGGSLVSGEDVRMINWNGVEARVVGSCG